MAFLITTTGTPTTVVINDLGKRTFMHPIVSFDLENEYSIEELINSNDLQSAITSSEITVVDESGNSVTELIQLLDMQSSYNKSIVNPEILTNSTLGAINIRRGSSLDTDNIITGQNGAGGDTFQVTGLGNVDALDYNGVPLTTGGSSTNYLDETGNYSVPSSSLNIGTGNTLWVDAVNGNDGTALPDRQDLQYLTISAAIAASTVGDAIIVRPGNYPEEGLDITGISLISSGQWEHTTIGPAPASSTQDTIINGSGGYIQGFSINVPSGSFNAINCNQVSGTNSVYDISLYGDGGARGSNGTGINRTGGGKTIGANIRVEGGGMESSLKVDSGVLALEGIHVPQSAGFIENVLLVTQNGDGGRAQMIGFNSGSSNVGRAIRIEGGAIGLTNNPTALIFNPNIFNCEVALSTDGEYLTSNLLGGRIENVTYAVAVDNIATGVGLESAIYRITSNHQPNYFYTPEVAGKSEFTLNFTQEPTSEFDSSFNIFGADQLSAGFTEKGIETSLGKGSPFTTGLIAFTSDNAGSATDGNNITDISSDVISKSGSTFTFPTGSSGDTITFGSRRYDVSSNAIKWWGLEMLINTGAIGNLGDYVFEIWDGTLGSWRIVSAMGTSAQDGHPYGSSLFKRGAPGNESKEFYRLGATGETAYNPTNFFKFNDIDWQPKDIVIPITGTVRVYWCRIRTTVPAGGGVNYPIFERCKLLDSAFNISKAGVPSSTGLGMFRKSIGLSGRVWSGSLTGGMDPTIDLGNYAETVGNTSGDNWTHEINYSVIAQGDSLSVQFPIPIGTCTAYPLKINLVLEFQSAGGAIDLSTDPVRLTVNALPQAISGNLIADPAGSVVPVRRDVSDADELVATGSRDPNTTIIVIDGTNDTIPGTTGATTWASLNNKLHEIGICEIDISTLFENDIVLLNIDYTSDGSGNNNDIVPFSLIISGVFHQDGAGI